MPMFHTPKPRQFRYQPRFYDPEQERWEERKAMHRLRAEGGLMEEGDAGLAGSANGSEGSGFSGASGLSGSAGTASASGAPGASLDRDLAYYEARVRQLEERDRRRPLGWRDLFRKREKPTFHYEPRFGAAASQEAGRVEATALQGVPRNATALPEGADAIAAAAPLPPVGRTDGQGRTGMQRRRVNIHRRFDVSDTEYMKPVPAGRIMLYALLVCMLLYWILF